MSPRPLDLPPRPLADFAPVLATAGPLLLVGGQAVNLWALYYADRTRELAPFVSRDVDVLGDRGTLIRLAKAAGTQPQFFPMRPPTNEVGAVIAKDSAGQPLLIEVLHHVHGVSNEELREPVYTVAIGTSRVMVQVPGPIALLQAKIANVVDLPQAGRQDARHAQILAQLMPAYLTDAAAAVGRDQMTERKLVTLLERLLGVSTKRTAARILSTLNIRPHAFFGELDPEGLPKVQAFVERRLPRKLRQ